MRGGVGIVCYRSSRADCVHSSDCGRGCCWAVALGLLVAVEQRDPSMD